MGLAIFILGALVVAIALASQSKSSGVSASAPQPQSKPRVPLTEAGARLATAIGLFETGSSKPFTLDATKWQGRAQRNNSPGNLRWPIGSTLVWSALASGRDGASYAQFPNEQAGWQALLLDVNAKLTGRTRTGLSINSTLAEFISVWAPSTENPTSAYISFVARELGISPGTKFSEWVEGA